MSNNCNSELLLLVFFYFLFFFKQVSFVKCKMFYQAECQDLLEEQLKVDGLKIREDIGRNVLIKLVNIHSNLKNNNKKRFQKR